MSYTVEEIQGFESRSKLLVDKLNRLKQVLILETDVARQMQLESEIARLETDLDDTKKCIAEAYDLGAESGQSRLREKIRELKITESMGRLHLVNCNRQELRDRFEEGFDARRKKGLANHYYFLSACPHQLPSSLGERMVYELLGELLEDGKNPVHCRVDPKNHDRVKIVKLPLGISLEKSQEMFREFCAAWFGWSDHQSFDECLGANRFPLARCRYSVLPLYLRKKEWKPFFPEYFNWIAGELAKRPPGGPTLLVFFVFYLDNLHTHYDAATGAINDEKTAEIIAAIDALCRQHDGAGHFYPLQPVEKADLQYWFEDLGERNPARLDPVFRTLAEGLPEDELPPYRLRQLLNMDRVELVQELVFELYNK